MKKIQSKMKELEGLQDFPHYESMGISLVAQAQLTPQSLVEFGLKFELFRDIIDVQVTCKYEEDPIKNEGPRVLTRFFPL